MIIANFTPDQVDWMHMGITGIIPAYSADSTDHIIDYEDSRARHILNKYARIGIVQMVFGDDAEKKKAESIALYNRFWEHQIEVFNQSNEQQKEAGNRYHRPTDILAKKAAEFELELKKPWTVPAKDSAKSAALEKENVELKETIRLQTAQITQILAALSGKLPQPAPSEPEAPEVSEEQKALAEIVTANRNKYRSLVAKTMSGWIKNNWEQIQEMPEENRFEIISKYEEIYQTPYPIEKPA